MQLVVRGLKQHLKSSRQPLRQACWLMSSRPTKLPRLGTSRCTTAAAAAAGQEASGGSMPTQALDQQDWSAIQAHLAEYDAQRETVIKRSRDAQKAAKQAIYSLHRADFAKATQQLETVEQVAKELLPIVQKEPTLRQGSFSNAMEEYAEARVFKTYLEEGRIIKSSELSALVNTEEYLGGVLDYTGELNRFTVGRATQRDVAAVQRARDVVDSIQGQFLQMDLRNGALRKKYDSLKYCIQKMENMLYDLSLAGAPKAGQANMPANEEEQPMMDNDEDAAA